ncbi:MAG: hypothetical protein LPD71_11650, partial [Shewanella sp.]|nr:hypothetical protein [Shewanella sp.]
YASNKLKRDYSNRCEVLTVHISKHISDDYFWSRDRIVVNQGFPLYCQAKNDSTDCQFAQTEQYGPEVTLTFKRKTDGQVATIRVQQNFCFLAAGNITVKPIRGKWVYRTRNGVWNSSSGNVWLDQVSLNN